MEVVVFESRSLIGNLAIRTEWYSGVFAHDKCNMPISLIDHIVADIKERAETEMMCLPLRR